jgi:Tol biopolymer transport system component
MNMDGSNVKQLTTIGTCHVISPDGKWVVYQVPKGEVRTLWKVSIDGGEPVQLTYKDECMAAISPDGKLIAYHYKGVKTNSDVGIAIMPFEGGEPIKLFELPNGLINIFPSQWTPDGRGIIYLSELGEVTNLWVQPIDGSAPKQITHFNSNKIIRFDLSFNGREIAYHINTKAKNVFLITDEENK